VINIGRKVDGPYLYIAQIFTRGHRTTPRAGLSKHVSSKLSLSKVISYSCKVECEGCLNTHLAYMVRYQKMERQCPMTKPIMTLKIKSCVRTKKKSAQGNGPILAIKIVSSSITKVFFHQGFLSEGQKNTLHLIVRWKFWR